MYNQKTNTTGFICTFVNRFIKPNLLFKSLSLKKTRRNAAEVLTPEQAEPLNPFP
jgi:hypothetical protein